MVMVCRSGGAEGEQVHAEHSRAEVRALRAAARRAPPRRVRAVAARAQGAAVRQPLQDARERARAQSGPGACGRAVQC